MTHTKARRGSKKSALGARSKIDMSVHPLLASIRAVARPDGPPPTITAPPSIASVEAAGDPADAAGHMCSAFARPALRVAPSIGARMAVPDPQRRARATQGSSGRGTIVRMEYESLKSSCAEGVPGGGKNKQQTKQTRRKNVDAGVQKLRKDSHTRDERSYSRTATAPCLEEEERKERKLQRH